MIIVIKTIPTIHLPTVLSSSYFANTLFAFVESYCHTRHRSFSKRKKFPNDRKKCDSSREKLKKKKKKKKRKSNEGTESFRPNILPFKSNQWCSIAISAAWTRFHLSSLQRFNFIAASSDTSAYRSRSRLMKNSPILKITENVNA